MFLKPVAILIGFLAIILIACTPTQPEPAANAPLLGDIVPYGNPITRQIDTTVETVANCLGNDHEKLSSRSASSTHAVEWRSGNTTGVGLTIGEGVVPGGVKLETAFANTFGQSFMDELTYTEGWNLFAHEGMINTITLLWHEDWQPAHLDVTFATGSTERVELSYRTRIYSTLVKEEETPCDDSVPPTTSTSKSENAVTVVATSPPATPPPILATDTPDDPRVGPVEISNGDINSMVGSGNWYCLSDYNNGIMIRNVPEGFFIEYPWEAVDKLGQRYNYGESIPEGGPATFWLQVDLQRTECPSENSNTQPNVTNSTLNTIFGAGNWYCLPDYDNGIGIRNLLQPVKIEPPWEAADKFGERYNYSNVVPGDGPATFWLLDSLPRGECP